VDVKTVSELNSTPHPFPDQTGRAEFGGAHLPIEFQWLRLPFPEELLSLTVALTICDYLGDAGRT
jgi:hypothetical protein